MLPPCGTARTAEGAPTAAATPRAAASSILAPLRPLRRPSAQRTMALPHLLVAAATLLGGTACGVWQHFTFRPHTDATPAVQCEARGDTERCLADGSPFPGYTVHYAASLLQAASPALASPWPADQLARWLPCPLLTSTACTNIVSQLSLGIVPSPTGPINYYTEVNQIRFWPWQGQTTYLRLSVGAASPKLHPHTPASFLGPTGRCMQQAPPQGPTAPSVRLVHTEACLAHANSLSPSWPTSPHWGTPRKFNQKPITTAQPAHHHYRINV